jgi:hypothetical protein
MSSRALITIRIDDLPEYLRSSAFAEAIDGEDDVIEVPANCYKRSLTIRDDGDLSLLLSTLRFWGVDTIPREVVLYIIWKNLKKFSAQQRSTRNFSISRSCKLCATVRIAAVANIV